MISNDDLYSLISEKLWGDIKSKDTYPEKRPLLAHYTTLDVLESIIKSGELWFSNPLFMNDLEELRFGILEGSRIFRVDESIKQSCKTDKRYSMLLENFDYYFNNFTNENALDTYVLCFSEHVPEDNDGVLSMWRGYGGDGAGTTIIFDTAKIKYNEDKSHLILSNVEYLSANERINWIQGKINDLASFLNSTDIKDEQLYLAAYNFFERLVIFSLFTKHRGFREEREWRAVYRREHDKENELVPMLNYNIGTRGVEPILKLKVEELPELSAENTKLKDFIVNIILGPTSSNPLSLAAVKRMLEKIGDVDIAKKLTVSSTPYRPK